METLTDADVAVGQLVLAGIPAQAAGNERQSLTSRHSGECFVWVPEELLEKATFVLAPPTLTEVELTRLALESPPPDDFTSNAWLIIDRYINPHDADEASSNLIRAGIPTHILGAAGQPVASSYTGECYLCIPKEMVENAARILAGSTLSKEELANQRLGPSINDDTRAPTAEEPNPSPERNVPLVSEKKTEPELKCVSPPNTRRFRFYLVPRANA